MTNFTFWHCGVLIGESELRGPSGNPRQRGGVFRPTPYGVELFPRLTGVLSAGAAFRAMLAERGVSEKNLDRAELEELLDTTPSGQKLIDVGRTISEVEMRAPNGRRLEFDSIAFIDMREIGQISRTHPPSPPFDVDKAVAALPAAAPKYIVSATLAPDVRNWKGDVRRGRPRRPSVYEH